MNIPTRAWHREPYVWLLIAFPAAAVVGGIVTIILALASADGLVVDDYYKHGLEINRVLDREKSAARAGITMTVDYDRGSTAIDVRLEATAATVLPDTIAATLLHATRAGFDRSLLLRRVAGDHYRAETLAIPAGRWYLDVGTATWRVTQRLVTD